jgi:hypothetical protein
MFTINLLIPIMATFVANKHFHCAVAVWTLNKVRNFSSNIRNLKVRAKMNRTSNFLMMFSKWKFIAFSDNHIFPFVKLCHCLQNCSSMANRSHNRPFGYNCPPCLILVWKQFLNMLCYSVCFLMHFCHK